VIGCLNDAFSVPQLFSVSSDFTLRTYFYDVLYCVNDLIGGANSNFFIYVPCG